MTTLLSSSECCPGHTLALTTLQGQHPYTMDDKVHLC